MIEKLIKNIAQQLDEHKIPYMIIGGQAVLLYGTPRLTRDIDITLGVDTDQFAAIKQICLQLGLNILPKDPLDFATETKVLPAEHTDSKIRIDFIFSFTAYETQAINRTKKVDMDAYPAKFASCEDVIIHKMLAARAIDMEDIKNMLIKNRNSIDLEYIRKWLVGFSKIEEYNQVLEIFNALLKKISDL